MKKQSKQQLQGKKKNIPTNASQVCSSITSTLNEPKGTVCRRDTLTCNNSDVNLPESNRIERNTKVFVLNIKGQPLMPTTSCKAKHLIKKGLAKVVKAYPFFVIQMLVQTRDCKQEAVLGIDSGYKNVGFSVVSSQKELVSGTVALDNKTKDRLLERKMYRRGRRNRHHWYRKIRFNNRKKKEGWLPPSIERRYNTHLVLIKKLKTILPIGNVVIETANFDIQKINNPNMQGKEYQQGNQLGFENVKQYVLTRDKRACQHCGKNNTKLEVHHIKFRSQGGTDNTDNLITLCIKCHNNLHNNKFEIKASKKDYKPNTFMSIIHKRFWKDMTEMYETFGYITKNRRLSLGLKKTHYNDAFCIAGGNTQSRVKPIELKQKHRNNRAIQLNRKGFAPSIRRQRYNIQSGDIVKINNKWYITNGMHSKGSRIIINKKSISIKNIEKYFNTGGMLFILKNNIYK